MHCVQKLSCWSCRTCIRENRTNNPIYNNSFWCCNNIRKSINCLLVYLSNVNNFSQTFILANLFENFKLHSNPYLPSGDKFCVAFLVHEHHMVMCQWDNISTFCLQTYNQMFYINIMQINYDSRLEVYTRSICNKHFVVFCQILDRNRLKPSASLNLYKCSISITNFPRDLVCNHARCLVW